MSASREFHAIYIRVEIIIMGLIRVSRGGNAKSGKCWIKYGGFTSFLSTCHSDSTDKYIRLCIENWLNPMRIRFPRALLVIGCETLENASI